MPNLEQVYKNLHNEMCVDGPINSLSNIRVSLKETIGEIDTNLRERKRELAIQYGLGYTNESLKQQFPDAVETSRDKVGDTTILTLTKEGVNEKFYFSKDFGLFIRGVPEKRENGLYCKITGTKLS